MTLAAACYVYLVFGTYTLAPLRFLVLRATLTTATVDACRCSGPGGRRFHLSDAYQPSETSRRSSFWMKVTMPTRSVTARFTWMYLTLLPDTSIPVLTCAALHATDVGFLRTVPAARGLHRVHNSRSPQHAVFAPRTVLHLHAAALSGTHRVLLCHTVVLDAHIRIPAFGVITERTATPLYSHYSSAGYLPLHGRPEKCACCRAAVTQPLASTIRRYPLRLPRLNM